MIKKTINLSDYKITPYEIIAKYNKQDIIYVDISGDYSGDFVIASIKDNVLYYIEECYGSCSVCDNFEGEFRGREKALESEVASFVEQYKQKSILLTEIKTYEDLMKFIVHDIGQTLQYSELDHTEIINAIYKKLKSL